MNIAELQFFTSSLANTEKSELFSLLLRHLLWSSNQFRDFSILFKDKTVYGQQTSRYLKNEEIKDVFLSKALSNLESIDAHLLSLPDSNPIQHFMVAIGHSLLDLRRILIFDFTCISHTDIPKPAFILKPNLKSFLLGLVNCDVFKKLTEKLSASRFHILVNFKEPYNSDWLFPKLNFRLKESVPIYVLRPFPSADDTIDIDAPTHVSLDFLYNPKSEVWYSCPLIIQGT